MVRFNELTEDDLRQIVDIQLEIFRGRLVDRHITLEISDDARAWLAKEGYDPAFGARPLKRVVQREVADKLAIKLLDGSFEDEASIRVDVDAEGSSLVFVEES